MVSEDTTNSEVVETQEETPLTDDDRMANALDYLGQEKLEKANEEQLIPDEQAEKAQEEQPQQDDRSDYYAKLVEKDREIRQLKSQLKGNESVDYKSMAKENPVKVLEDLGINMDQVIDAWVGDDSPSVEEGQEPRSNDEISQLRQEIQALKEEREQSRIRQAWQREMQMVHGMVNAEGEDRWELVKTTNNYLLVMDTAREFFEEQGEAPQYEDVLNAVEKHLEERYGELYEKLSKISKLHNKMAVKIEETKPLEKIQQEVQKPPTPSPTLSTAHSSDTPTPRGFTEAERFERALQVLETSGD
jgi:hypothetical protein